MIKYWWLVILIAACEVRLGAPMHGPRPDPEPKPAPEAAADPAAQAAERDRELRTAAKRIATKYDDLFDQYDQAGRETDAHHDEDAVERYRGVVSGADELLARVADRDAASDRDARVPYPTEHDGALDDAALVSNLRALRVRSTRRIDKIQDQGRVALEAELHATTPGQREIVGKRGRPAEVARRRGQTCWIYRDDATEDTYCWTSAGRLAKHGSSKVVTARRAEASTERSPAESESAERSTGRAKPKAPARPARFYYAAATFASGSCSSSNCFKNGWTTRLPDGSSADTSCSSSDCMKNGWTTRLPDGSSANTSCSSSDCMKNGWTTRLPDGSSADTSCSSSDCLKNGWTTRLPDGRTVSCQCSSSDCLKNGASCG